MARRSNKKSRTSRRRRQGGGGLGHSYTFGAPIVDGLGNSAEVIPTSSCMAVDRFGTVSMPTGSLGLPGFRGGARSRKQRGGRYSFDLSAPVGNGAALSMGGPPPVVSIPCEASRTPIPQTGGVGGVDSAFYTAPTAGYGNQPSTWVGSTGSPSMLQIPYDARTMNPACLKTGGARKTRSRGSKRSRGSRSKRSRRSKH